MRSVALAIVGTLMATGTARADDRAGDAVEAPPAKDPATAAWLSAGTTVVGMAAVVAAGGESEQLVGLPVVMLVGPSVGHWYARDVWSVGLGVRLAGAATIGVGLTRWCDPDDPGERCGGREVYLAGGALLLVGAILDIATAPEAARRANRGTRPTVVPTVTGDRAGVAVVGAF